MTRLRLSTRTQGFLRSVLAWPRSRVWTLCADVLPALAAAALPWSTSAVGALIALWFIVVLPMVDWRANSLGRPAVFLPLVFVALAIVGMLWASDPWPTRWQGAGPVLKLAAIPLLLYQFERSERGHWVFIAFLGSCSLLMLLSWITAFDPRWKISGGLAVGVPVRNYIDQTQEFALCLFGLAPFIPLFIERRQNALAWAAAGLLVAFMSNMSFVAMARTAFLYMPLLAILFAVRFRHNKPALGLLALGVIFMTLFSFSSPYLRDRVQRTAFEYNAGSEPEQVSKDGGGKVDGETTSLGERLQYWQLSLDSISMAPIFGHGTGSTKLLFEKYSEGKTGERAHKIRNPHNQTLYVAIQWGLLGCIILYAMWGAHLALFRGAGLVAWIGLVVVAQNIASSLVNSHLFDFHEGWLYVLGVGTAGGMVARKRTEITEIKDTAGSATTASAA